MDWRSTPAHARELFIGDSRDHLVGVHVGRGAAAGLENVENELVVVLALADRLRGPDDRRPQLLGEQAEIHVDLGRGFLDQPQRPDEPARKP
jgi:hypothetical protein